jgi:non-ribosomal peptide synthase protein (TIGR01720 family)
VSRIWLVPSLLRAILETWPDLQEHLPHLKFWVTSGEPLSGQLLRRFRAAMPGNLLINLYGTSEVFDATLYEAGLDTQGLASVPIGHPIANVQVYVLDSSLQPVPVGVPGELYVGGVGLARGYLNQPALTAVRFVPDPFGDQPGGRLYRTGDGVQYLPQGEMEFLGRLDYQVKIRGYRIEPGDVEAALVQHQAVRQTVVVAALAAGAAEGESDGKRLVAYVVPEQEATPEAGELRRFLQQKLPDYMVPAVFVTLEALPLTPNGKVDRLALPAPDRARPDLEEKFVAPRTRVEESLAHVWSQLLGVEQVGVYDDFFELGGHSLLTTRLISRVHQLFEVEIPLRTVLENPTIAELAEQIVAKQLEPVENGVICSDSGTELIPLTSGQYFFFEQNPVNPHHYNLDGFMQAPFAINTVLLEKVLRYLEQYHDALRLRFFRAESGWRQHVVPAGEQIPLYVLDLAEYPVAEQERVLASEIKKPQASLNITHGPTWVVVLFDLGPERPARILFIIHHLIADGWSIPILFQDMQVAYLQLLQGQEIRLAREKTSFTAWARRLYEFAQSPQLRREVAYWLADGRKHTPEFPCDHYRGPNNMASSDIVTETLGRDDTQSLIEWVRQEPGVQIGDVLLGALVYTLVEWVGGRTLLIDVVKHGREEIFPDVNLTRTVGWLAVGFPMFFDLTGAANLNAAWLSIKQQLASVPNAGLGFSLLTHSCEDRTIGDRLKAMPKSKVLFNFIGELGQARSEAPLDSEAPDDDSQADDQKLLDHRDGHNLEQMRPFLFHVETYLPANGTLCIEWGYSTNLYRRSTIQALAQNTFDTVRALLNLSGCPAGGAHIASQLRS